ncbi:HotDog domain-containing protein [Coprinopsis sp. MPI-PUGE-AT-0042]|nr:HotDog domain-containing protein [Coprinopsis sp. MPI-PUGE-AT-0042]
MLAGCSQRAFSSANLRLRSATRPFAVASRANSTSTAPLKAWNQSSEEYKTLLENAKSKFLRAGFDPDSFLEQRIVWGDQDAFQHVNNVRYIRFFESARIKWMQAIGTEWAGPQKADDMIKAKGTSLILGSIDVVFRRPVTYPDTLLIGYCPVPPKPGMELSPKFNVVAAGYSLQQQEFAIYSKETLVWYDYENLKKCRPPPEAAGLISKRAREIDLRTLHHA